VSAVRLLAEAEAQYEWFYWLAPIMFVGAVLMCLALWGGYVKKVLIPKHRGRRVEE
jgi:hypothetical protein